MSLDIFSTTGCKLRSPQRLNCYRIAVCVAEYVIYVLKQCGSYGQCPWKLLRVSETSTYVKGHKTKIR